MDKKFKFEWVVVEERKPSHRRAAIPSAPGMRPTGAGHGFEGADLVAATPRLESMTIDEANETQNSADVRATLVNMPIRLIEPAVSAGGAGEPIDLSWGIRDIGADHSPFDGRGVVVAVLDTGIDAGHEAFAGMELIREDFTGEGLVDTDGHGTHCAGTIFGRNVGGVRIGVAPGVRKALIGKVLGKEAGGTTQSLVKALAWAQFHGADVISMSLGMDFPGFFESLMKKNKLPARQAASIALEGYRLNLEMFNKLSTSVIGVPGVVEGSIVVGAAGNESEFPNYTIAASLPANALDFVSVAALSPSVAGAYALAPFSNVGAKIGAPGTGIWRPSPVAA